jgi:hypothetical protein
MSHKRARKSTRNKTPSKRFKGNDYEMAEDTADPSSESEYIITAQEEKDYCAFKGLINTLSTQAQIMKKDTVQVSNLFQRFKGSGMCTWCPHSPS